MFVNQVSRNCGRLLQQVVRKRALENPVRQRHSSAKTPMNTVVVFVPQQEAWVVERMGKFRKILDPGLNILLPIVDSVKYVQSLKEIAIDIPQQSAITADNVGIALDGVLYLRVVDPYKSSYGVEDPEFAITQLAQTTMRSELGKISLDSVFKERESLNIAIVQTINQAANSWGITCLRYEIKDIKIPSRVQEAMQMQVEAERKKRAAILESEGFREANINVAEGRKQSKILASEAQKIEQINIAQGIAISLKTEAEGKAKALKLVGDVLTQNQGSNAASLSVAEQYVEAFANLAKNSNTMILSSDASNVSKMVAQAFSVYKTLEKEPRTEQEPLDHESHEARTEAEYDSDFNHRKK